MCHVFRVCSQQCSSPSIGGGVEVSHLLDSAGFDILDCSSSRRVVRHPCRIYSKAVLVWLKTESRLLPTTRYIKIALLRYRLQQYARADVIKFKWCNQIGCAVFTGVKLILRFSFGDPVESKSPRSSVRWIFRNLFLFRDSKGDTAKYVSQEDMLTHRELANE